jgi:NADH-quinone oxidoreductase subunit L
LEQFTYPFRHAPLVVFIGSTAVVIGYFVAYKLYSKAKSDPLPAKLGALSRAMQNRFYFDEIYEATVIRLHDCLAAIANFIDRWIVEGFCIGLVRGGTDLVGQALRMVQTGNLQTYAFLLVLGVAVVLWFVLGK